MALHVAEATPLPFADRREAGRLLGRFLERYLASEGGQTPEEVVVLGLPRGGVVVAAEVARALGAALDVLPSRKLGAPGNPELAIGAASVAGEPYLSSSAHRLADDAWIAAEIARQRERIATQIRDYRGDDDFSYLRSRTGLIVDDGTATGATALAACKALRTFGAAAVWVAVPVAPPEALSLLSSEADEVLALASRTDFQAVGMWYVDFSQTEDGEVRKLLEEFGGRPSPDIEKS